MTCLFQEIPSCLQTLGLGTRGLGYSPGTADSVEGVRTREGVCERFLRPALQAAPVPGFVSWV